MVAVVGTLTLAVALITAGALNRGTITSEVVLNISVVSAATMLVLAGLGYIGARTTVLGTFVGLLLGYAQMVWVFTRSNDGFADLAGLAGFLMFAALGLALGLLLDLTRLLPK
jgi:hypothetical protein